MSTTNSRINTIHTISESARPTHQYTTFPVVRQGCRSSARTATASVRSAGVVIRGALVMVLAGWMTACAARSHADISTAAGSPLSPFEALPATAAYEGVGLAELGHMSLRAARDVAYAQAYRLLTQDIVTQHVNRLTELAGTGRDPWVAPVGTTVSRVLLVGKKFTEERRVKDQVWVRVYMSKKEVDESIGPAMQRLVADLEPAMRDAYAKDLQGVSPVEEELNLLSEFQRKQGRR